MCDKVAIMYAGEVVEYGTLEQVFRRPTHPYTKGLFASIPNMAQKVRRLTPIKGMMPDPTCLPEGCKFAGRCPHACPACAQEPQLTMVEPGHTVKCVLAERSEGRPSDE